MKLPFLTLKQRELLCPLRLDLITLMLIERSDPELKDLVNQKMLPGTLLLNFLSVVFIYWPVDEDAKLGGISLKNVVAEERAIIAYLYFIEIFRI